MAPTNPEQLLLASAPSSEEGARCLAAYGFRDPKRAFENLRALARASGDAFVFAGRAHRLLDFLRGSASPDQALNLLERFATAGIAAARPFVEIEPDVLKLLAEVFGASPFLADILIRHPRYVDALADPALGRSLSKRDYLRELSQGLGSATGEEGRLHSLRLFKEKALLRIGARDLARLSTVEGTLRSLSALAEALIQKAYETCESSLRSRFRRAGHRTSTRRERAGFTVLGLGKLGGGELNFSSDVDLVYLYASDQEPAALRQALTIPLPDFFRHLARKLTSALGDVTHAGSVYRVDLRLRPEGRMGGIVQSLKSTLGYYASRGATWERLALLKAWPVAGDRGLGLRFLRDVGPFVYATPFEKDALMEVRNMKARIDARLRAEGESHRNVKLGFGGIREVELVVQALQVALGKKRKELRQRNTLRALTALARNQVLSPQEEGTLARAYLFLRDVENKLQMVHALQTHSLPLREEEVRLCALRLGYRDHGAATAQAQLLADYRRSTEEVNGIFSEVLDPRRSPFASLF